LPIQKVIFMDCYSYIKQFICFLEISGLEVSLQLERLVEKVYLISYVYNKKQKGTNNV
jgi:hypothetical protein